MYTRFVMMALWSLIATALWPQFAFSAVDIDTFATGTTNKIRVTCGSKDQTQTGSMVGGTRFTRLIVNQPPGSCNATNQYRQTASFQVREGGPLVLNSDFRVFRRFELIYGKDEQGNNFPLNFDLTEGGLNDRIRIAFDGNDLVENFNIVLFMQGGNSRSHCGINLIPKGTPYSVDFSLANFVTQLGTADYTDVDFIVLVFQSGGTVGGNDLAVQSVVATSGGDPFIRVASCR